MQEKKHEAEKLSWQQTLRLSPQMAAEIQKSCKSSGISFMDWVRGACRERLEREKYDMNSPVGKMTVEELKDFVQKVILETEIESRNMHPEDVARYDRVLFRQARPFDLMDEFYSLETEEERDEWAENNLYELDIEIDPEDIPEGVAKIYGVLQGRIVWADEEGGIGLSKFEEFFPCYEEEEVEEEADSEEVVEEKSKGKKK